MKECPYCHKEWDDKHTLIHMTWGTMIGCPLYPKLSNPIFINQSLWSKGTIDLSHLKQDIKDLLK